MSKLRLFPLLFFALQGLSAAEPPPFDPLAIPETNPVEAFDNSRFLGEFFYMLLMLAILVGMVYFLAWFLKRMTHVRVEQQNAGSAIKVIERRPINNRTTIYLLEIENKQILIAETPTTVVQLNHKEER